MIPEYLIWIAVVINFVGYYWYVKDIFLGHTRPNLVSWSLWVLAPFFGVFFQLKAGAGLSVLPVFIGGFGPLIVVIVALLIKKAHWKINAFDVFCGIVSVFALVLYVLTKNLSLSILFAIISDLLAFIPTFVKGWNFPKTETSLAYACYTISQAIGLLVIKDWSFVIYSFGMYLMLGNLVMLLILYRRKIFAVV